MLTKEQILRIDDIKTEVVSIPEWGGEVKIRMLKEVERERLEKIAYPYNKKVVSENNIRALWCVFSVLGDDGELLFGLDDIDGLNRKSSAALDRIFTAALRLNKVTDKDIDEMAANFEPAQTEDSNSN